MLRTLKNVAKKVPFVAQIGSSINIRRSLTAKITSPAHNTVALESNGIPIPPIQMRDKVRKSAILAEDFILEGRQAYEAVTSCLTENGIDLGPETTVYEFGVGCGRIARHFAGSPVRFIGSDVDDEMVQWGQANLSPVGNLSLFTNTYLPPLPLEQGEVDAMYSISVFTHMDAKAQIKWLKEAARVIRPGGSLLISFLEQSSAELPSGIDVRERMDPEYVRPWFGVGGAPSVYYDTYNTVDYLKSILRDEFEFKDHRPGAIRGRQSLLLAQRKA